MASNCSLFNRGRASCPSAISVTAYPSPRRTAAMDMRTEWLSSTTSTARASGATAGAGGSVWEDTKAGGSHRPTLPPCRPRSATSAHLWLRHVATLEIGERRTVSGAHQSHTQPPGEPNAWFGTGIAVIRGRTRGIGWSQAPLEPRTMSPRDDTGARRLTQPSSRRTLAFTLRRYRAGGRSDGLRVPHLVLRDGRPSMSLR